ncbi:hypothetical protein GA0061091_104214 [Gordonia sp. v-85]|nr:hypothetical protein GA0061091_104214 [Gordonia sp. v-85]
MWSAGGWVAAPSPHTLDAYGDWIPEEGGGALNDLPDPSQLIPHEAPESSDDVPLFGR